MCTLSGVLIKQFLYVSRALSLIYRELEKRTEESLSVHLSYLEIYQEIGYDLLNPGARTGSYVTPFPKVSQGYQRYRPVYCTLMYCSNSVDPDQRAPVGAI